MRRKLFTIMALISLLLPEILVPVSGHAASTTLYVKWNAGGSNNGTSWANAFTSLQSALATASDGSQIWVAAGTYKPTSSMDRTAAFMLKNGVAIYGGFAGTETLLSQRDPAANATLLSGDIGIPGNNSDNSYHVVRAEDINNTAVLDGFTITDGNANGSNEPYDRGGGLYNLSSSPALSNLTFSSNEADSFGGGMYNKSGHPWLNNLIFSNNISYYLGGGLYSESGGSLILTNANFSNNHSDFACGGMVLLGSNSSSLTDVTFVYNTAESQGGGMCNSFGSHPTLTRVTFQRNAAGTNGGGMSNSNSNPILNEVIFIENDAIDFGAGMINFSSNPVLNNVVFDDNLATSGGGMENRSSSPVLTNSTFSANVAFSEGGGMRNIEGSHPILTNVTFSGNTAYAGAGVLNESSNPTLKNVTFTGNQANFAGGGLVNVSSNPILTNVILWGDSANSGAEIYNVTSAPVVTYSIVQGAYPGTGNLNVDPVLGPLQDNGGFTKTMALTEGSPAIDAGNDVNCPPTDQRGVSRPQGSHCDIGSFEVRQTFIDVPFTHMFWRYIEAFYRSGLTTGCSASPRKYCPDALVTRAEMATFIERALGNFSPTPSPTGMFADVPYPGLEHLTPFIEEFYNDGITTGCSTSPRKYCPAANVTRAEMATFIERALGNFNPNPNPRGMFADVPYPGLEHLTPFIEEFYNDGITTGCAQNPLRYCPANKVTRAEMAVFIVRAFGIPLP